MVVLTMSFCRLLLPLSISVRMNLMVHCNTVVYKQMDLHLTVDMKGKWGRLCYNNEELCYNVLACGLLTLYHWRIKGQTDKSQARVTLKRSTLGQGPFVYKFSRSVNRRSERLVNHLRQESQTLTLKISREAFKLAGHVMRLLNTDHQSIQILARNYRTYKPVRSLINSACNNPPATVSRSVSMSKWLIRVLSSPLTYIQQRTAVDPRLTSLTRDFTSWK